MALCSAAEVKVYAPSNKLTDTDYENIINIKSKEIAQKARGSADASGNSDLNLACIHASAAQALWVMQINGELAASVKLGNDQTNNNIGPDIQDHEAQAEFYIKKYRAAAGISIPYGRTGPGTVDDEGTNSQLSSSSPVLRRI
jgi:hypothetical protein